MHSQRTDLFLVSGAHDMHGDEGPSAAFHQSINNVNLDMHACMLN